MRPFTVDYAQNVRRFETSSASTYRFVGRLSYVGSLAFARVGQQIDLDEAGYEAMCAEGGAMFLSEEEFSKISFTAEELQRYTEDYHGEVPAEFQEKVRVARERFQQIQSSIIEDGGITY